MTYTVRKKLQEKDQQTSILSKKQENFEKLIQSLIDSWTINESN